MISIGDKSFIYPDRVECAVTGGGEYGPGYVMQMSAFEAWSRLTMTADRRSGSRRSGHVVYALGRQGLYRYVGVGSSNRAEATGHFELTDAGDVIRLDDAGVTATVQRLFPDESAVKAAAERAETERRQAEAMKREREEAEAAAAAYDDGDDDLQVLTVDSGESASRILPTKVVGAVVRAKGPGRVSKLVDYGTWTDLDITRDNRIWKGTAGNVVWNLHGDGLYRHDKLVGLGDNGGTFESTGFFRVCGKEVAFIENAAVDAIRAELFPDGAAALCAVAAALPALSGTPKQIAWADKIRGAFAIRFPNDKRLSSRKRAAWWIDNRFGLAA